MRHRAVHGRVQDLVFVEVVHDPISAVNKDEILVAAPRNRYLFETRRFGPFTTRRIQQIVQAYRETAGITQPLHPHLFRHQMLTYLTSKGLTDAQIQLISGHQSKKSLEIYQHLSLQSVEKAYQEAVLNAAI
jgi:integrase/recombinase XerD